LVLADDDPALAAEPEFHRDAPQGGGTEGRSIRRLSEHGSEPLAQQPENGLALASGPAQASGGVKIDRGERSHPLKQRRLKRVRRVGRVGRRRFGVASGAVGVGEIGPSNRHGETPVVVNGK